MTATGLASISDLAVRHNLPVATVESIFNEGHASGRVAPRISDVRAKASDVAKQINREWYHEAAKRGMSLSLLLEERDPSAGYDDWIADKHEPSGRRRMDAFERQLMIADIRTRPDLKNGLPSHTVERFYMSDSPASPVLFPEFINRTLRAQALEPSLLDEMIAIRTMVDGSVYRSFRLVEDEGEQRLQRVTERAEPRRVQLTGNDEVTRLHKFGVVLDMSYEVVRRMNIDLFGFHIGRIAQQNDVDKAAAAVDVIVNGDGNADTAATNWEHQADLAGTGTALEFAPYIRFLMKFRPPYRATTIVGQEQEIAELMTLSVGSANIPLALWSQYMGGAAGAAFPRESRLAVSTFVLDDAPANHLVAIDKQRALQLVSEIGADLTETDKIIAKQINEVVITETTGFSVLDPMASKTLDLAT